MRPAETSRPLPTTFWRALVHPWVWRMAWRDSRSQRARLLLFSLAIVSGISALVALHSLKATVETGIGTQAKALLGSDLQISSRQPFSDADEAQLTRRARAVSHETSLSTMLSFPAADAARLVQVRGLDGAYPFYGQVETTPANAWASLRTRPGIVLETALLDQFRARVGDQVKLGSLLLPIVGVFDKAPPSNSQFGGFAPEAYVRLADLDRTGLLGKTSLALHLLHLQLPEHVDAPAVKHALQVRFPAATWRIETWEDRRKSLGESLDHFQEFLGLIALVALVLGAIGVAGAVHAHVSRRMPTVAILRCLGCPGDLAFGIYLAQALALTLFGAVLGAAVGIALHLGVLAFFRASLPIAVDPLPEWRTVALTTVSGLAVCGGFALLPLLRVRGITPAATLRDGAALEGDAPTPAGTWLIYALLAGLLVWLAVLNSSHWLRALGLVGGLGVAVGALFGIARALVVAARRLVRPDWPYLLRQGISNLHRPHNQTLLFLLSLGLGAFLILTILLARQSLTGKLQLGQFAETPNIYLVDVQPDQIEGVRGLLTAQHLPVLESAPMITMRIQSVRGVSVRELRKNKSIPKWVLQREFRSTYRDHLNSTETLAGGQWFTHVPNPDNPVPLSLEVDLAKDLGVAVGDEMTLDVQGTPVRARVTSLRKVDWSRFNLNFFMVFPPGVLEAAPGFEVLTTRLPAGTNSGNLQRTLVQKFPNVSAIDLSLVLETVRGILLKISRVVTVLAGFTVFAGLPILIGTLLHGRGQRLRESMLLRTLGASARQVRTILFVEYATLGALSALAGVLLAIAAHVALALFVFQASPWPDPRLLAFTFLATTILAILGGLAVGRGVAGQPPLEILRESAGG